MKTEEHYKLTKYPVGSLREIWAMSWPLMLGLISASLMMFVDRLLLSRYSPMALNAGANAGMACYIFLVIPMAVAAISEVLVGRLRGEERSDKIGSATWQMVWFSFLTMPIFLLLALLSPMLLFYRTGNEVHETVYFQTLMCFAPFLCASIALSGFFIGTGKVRVVTYCTIFGNLVNIILAYLFIFGYGSIPSMGIKGAAIATGIAQVSQIGLLFLFFLKREHRETFGTTAWRFDPIKFWEGIKIGAPAGSGHMIEVIAHYLFFRIIMSVSNETMTLVALVQSFYILGYFVVEAQSKGVSAIIANLLGAKKMDLLRPVFFSAVKLHSLFFIIFAAVFLIFPDQCLQLFTSEENRQMLQSGHFVGMFYRAVMWMSLFFLCDGFSWILIGHLTASGDTKFIFRVSALINWAAYVLPTFLIIGMGKHGADVAWMIIALYSVLNFCIYLWRYRSGRWLAAYKAEPEGV